MTNERPDNWPLNSFDAAEWAKAFCIKASEPYDEELMIGWFANALMRGYDEQRWRYERKFGFKFLSRLFGWR